ncbi:MULTISPECIES: mechanosensitive ion channel domain-containing protein [unclassified Okeania]|uniref:mechanosensitive ion channel domain-containing protein n=1 Tax=unclassified Okeania TaxID=2634635 RepID=UPI0013BE033A|nr:MULTISPECIES: mechanosensitive ion channel domain-containing protein [unclassified Okeania]NES78903.1 mechanosensitive ion channel [Okeania sp. SIO1H4]NET22413.1 mechanosensitive ion channel [Okeania sp. SIO1H5]NET95597.1 mechanosensitive ion channel [Okeania sp. SIO1H2]
MEHLKQRNINLLPSSFFLLPSSFNYVSKLQKYGFRLILALCICLLSIFLFSPVLAEDATSVKAPVVLDGRELLEIGPFEKVTAQERAALMTSTLKSALAESIQRGTPPQIKVIRSNQEVVLKIDSRPLMQVTEADVLNSMYSEMQVQMWQEKLQQGLNQSWRERTPAYTRWAVKKLIIAFLITLLLQGGLVLLFRYIQRQKLQNPQRRWNSLQLLGLLLLQVGVWATFIKYGIQLFPITRAWFYEAFKLLDSTFNSRMFQLGEESISLTRILTIALTIVALWVGVSWFVRILKSRFLPLTEAERSHQDTIAFFVQYGLLSVGAVLILNAGGVDFQSLAILLGALGVGIGFGLQNIVKDFICGLILIVARPVKVGELVQVGEFQGLVQRIGARTTDISNIERYIITIPNSRFIEGEVLNWNRSGITRVKTYVKVPYGTDIDFVYKVLLAAAQVEHPDILRHPPPKVKFRQYTEDGLQFRVVAFIRDPLKQPKVRTHLYNQIERYLRKYGVEVARPQQDLHIKDLDPEIYAWLRSQTPVEYQSQPEEIPSIEPPAIKEEYDWGAIATAMRGANGVSIKDRKFQFKKFQNVFFGSDAVEWLMIHERATREEAILMGQLMLEQGIIHHVLDEHNFKDEPLFYRFYDDETSDNFPEKREQGTGNREPTPNPSGGGE